MSRSDVMQDVSMACLSDQGSSMDNLSFDDFDPNQGSLDFFEDFTGMDKMDGSAGAMHDNVYVQLEQKEKDLILAAELGKALLERNEELTTRQDQLQQEMADKMEELEQEKHHLRRRLEAMAGEYESKLLDLQTEISSLHKEVANQKTAQKNTEKEKKLAVDELSEQNQKLVQKLKQASGVEEELNEHIKRLRDQVHLRRQHSLHHREKTYITDELQQEVQRLSGKRGELERRLHTTTNDRDSLASSLKETNDRCQMLEKQCKDLEQELQLRDADLTKLHQVHNDMTEELEELRYQATLNSPSKDFLGNSLLSELGFELSGSGPGQTVQQDLGDVDQGTCEDLGDVDQGTCGMASVLVFGEDIECDDDEGQGVSGETAVITEKKAAADEEKDDSGEKDICQDERCTLERQTLQDVLDEVHTTLSKIVYELKAFQVSSNPIGSPLLSLRPATSENVRQEHLETQPKQVRSLLRDLTSATSMITKRLHSQAEGTSSISSTETDIEGRDGHIEALEGHIEALRGELCSTQAHIELLQAETDRQQMELKRKDTELCTLAAKTWHKLTQVLYSEVRNLERELKLSASLDYTTSCDETDPSSVSSDDDKLERLLVRQESSDEHQDLSSSVSQDEFLDRLQTERDEAVLRRSFAEQELCQAKSDMSKLDDQLIWAVKQKASLSEQLDQWQIDIHQLLDQGLKKQLTRQESRRAPSKKPKGSPQKRFTFWS